MNFANTLCLLFSTASALVLPQTTPNCTSFVTSVSLASLNATFLNATYYPTGSLNVSAILNTVPFCEVYASVSYGTGNDTLAFALWLPDTLQYEDRFMAVGNGGMAGTIKIGDMLTQLNSGMGFAVAGGNAGHLASANIDGPGLYLPYLHDAAQTSAWIHNAISLFTPAAKALTAAYYGKTARYAYYVGCSTGGVQGFALALYHSELFDGIVAGTPATWYSHLALSFLWNAQHTNSTASNLTQAILNFTTTAVLDACDTLDGLEDRLIENPLQCNFDIDSLACNGSYSSLSSNGTIECLTADQIEAAKAIYAGPTRSDNGSELYPGYSLGSEIEWLTQEGPLADALSIPLLQNLVYDDLSYDSSTFNWASDVADVDRKAGSFIDAISPDLSAFRKHGGKMIVTQGWADPTNPAIWPIEQFERIQDFFDGDVSDFFNLFMVPGGGHCGAAPYYPGVPGTYHTVPKLVQWVERGETPDELLSTSPLDGSTTTRKLCAWPATARYVSGDASDWDSYVCE
ncbi:hypothetical protein LTR36_002573 [Oleoguttula mirabilis]|uniref:Carboxylic ester hydrolase n=1 Tax=Oleoguttula mirabilis TaxID=1507867 RepID=A0AAV9JJN8_9PEZI|nr:hypothetical protein LTR36_002573 [Oleoguttula mirabilis]